MSSRAARPIFCGNLDYDARQSDIERLFGKYGNVERVDLKSGQSLSSCTDCFSEIRIIFLNHLCRRQASCSFEELTSSPLALSSYITSDLILLIPNDMLSLPITSCPFIEIMVNSGFAFVYMEDDQDADDAVRRLDRREFGPKGRRLRVEWTKQDRGGRQYGDSRKASMKSQPSRTLFIINFDPIITRLRDLERHFDSYGKIVNVRIRRNFAFVQFETQEEATKALDATNSSKFMDRILSVEYATRDDDDNQRSDDRRNGRSPDRRGRDRSPERGYNSRRSPSPLRRDRDSPDYGHGSKPISRYEPRRSPNYERTDKSLVNNVDIKRSSRHERQRSPSYERQRSPSNDSPGRSPVNDRDTKLNYDGPDRSPANDDGAMLSSEHEPYESPIYGRTKRSPGGARDSSRSPSPTER